MAVDLPGGDVPGVNRRSARTAASPGRRGRLGRAGPAHLTLSAKEGPAPGTWRYNLTDGPDHRAACGRVAGKGDYLDVLRYAAGICATSYQPGTTERGLLEQFATAPPDEDSPLP